VFTLSTPFFVCLFLFLLLKVSVWRSAVPPTHEGETVFHAKPVKVKRSGNRAQQDAQQVPADESDAVFRGSAKQVKAQEVEEDDNLKVDLPIDQARGVLLIDAPSASHGKTAARVKTFRYRDLCYIFLG